MCDLRGALQPRSSTGGDRATVNELAGLVDKALIP